MSEQQSVEQRIRGRAYALWQDAGCPDGRDHEFWHQAEAEEGASLDVIATSVDEAGIDSFPASDPTDRT